MVLEVSRKKRDELSMILHQVEQYLEVEREYQTFSQQTQGNDPFKDQLESIQQQIAEKESECMIAEKQLQEYQQSIQERKTTVIMRKMQIQPELVQLRQQQETFNAIVTDVKGTNIGLQGIKGNNE